jgi:type IV pilus assembly protein PilY1
VYALDVTDPDNFGPSSVLFEFTDEDDADLGFTYSQPSIAKLGDGNWYVIFGNGYNSMLNDPVNPRASTTGDAVLFLVALQSGANGTRRVIKLNTEIGYADRAAQGVTATYGNGLATPSVVDVDGDRIADYVYAGDLYGNMWKFDVTGNNSTAWAVAFGNRPLFKALNDAGQAQPITVRPEIARGPMGNGQMVLFGTGKYLESNDKIIAPAVTQSFYGIVDRNARVTYTTARSTVLTQQEITREQTVTRNGTTSTVRVTTNRPLGSAQGWYMDLLSPTAPRYRGERQVTNPTVRNGAVIFTTLIPDEDPCNFGGTSWLMELDLLDGSRLDASPFDLNRDGLFDEDDNVSESGGGNDDDNVPPSGLASQEGILQAPGIGDGNYGADGTAVQYKYLPGSSGNIQIVIENPGLGGTGRQSWRQLR